MGYYRTPYTIYRNPPTSPRVDNGAPAGVASQHETARAMLSTTVETIKLTGYSMV